MDDRIRFPLSRPTILLFGPLALSFDYAAFSELRKTVVGSSEQKWVLDTIAELPKWWKAITEAIPSLDESLRLTQLEDLCNAFQKEQPLKTPIPLPNTLLIPLVIISHLTQYTAFRQRASVGASNSTDIFASSKSDRETLGLCTGLLSSFAVSSAGSKDRFAKYGAVAVRLGMLIGMLVDVTDSASGLNSSRSISTAWNSAEKKDEMLRVLESFPEAYISVNYDENRATVTTAASTVPSLQEQLRASGIIVSEVGLYGRFHSELHRDILAKILEFCDANPEFQFPDASELTMPTRSNYDGHLILQGPLHHHALRSILVETPQWFRTFCAAEDAHLKEKDGLIVSFGSEHCVPPTLMRKLRPQVTRQEDILPQESQRANSDNDIAVIGMACKVAGADNINEFWDLLCSGKSQHKEVTERFSFQTPFRDDDPKRKWFANLISGADMFDHKFFKKSPRESATMDPQQRHMLQIAYQAVEQSGYFHTRSEAVDNRIGCYVGVRGCDYYDNIACHPANAFAATGNLQAFIAGKISHYFGWTGPAMTIDTACSSSLVAIHQACRAIISGECNAALAGGAHVMTSPLWFQNLAGASFLSTTGQCKPFDAKADGYCRGDGVGAVFLKRLSSAIADGDQILGVVPATAVQQNLNCTPIFVPNSPSLSNLFQIVTSQAHIEPSDISVVEAHGTGTAVGDPAEYDGIRQALGGSKRTTPLIVSSVKGLVGHTECASGIVAMIKILLMIQNGKIPPQASFNTINPAINATPADNMRIPTNLIDWNTEFRAALINNYGASGSNASMILTQSPFTKANTHTQSPAGLKFPFWFCGLDDDNIRRYSRAFLAQINLNKNVALSSISFNLARQSNRLLDRALIFSAKSVDELKQKLSAFEKGDASITSVARPVPRPVVLCFGGQISTFVGLDQEVYNSVAVLRQHIDSVNDVACSLGGRSILPGIFQRTPIQDIVELQTMLFAMQFASAQSWIESGVQPVALVGHSFGELTALCISQILSLEDAVKMVINRATIVRDTWGSDKGSMIAVEADLNDVEELLAKSNKCHGEIPATIACYNGPRSFTVAGSTAAVDAIVDTVSREPAFSAMRTKRLNVTNAFHCALLDPLLEQLEQGAQNLTFRKPVIPLERSTQTSQGAQEKITPRFVADHIRSPVFFHHAVERLHKQYPSCIFLEAGSNSTITSMVGRALGNPSSSHFQPVNITSDDGWNKLTDATLSLWKAGLSTRHWAHHAAQTKEHTPLLLPPYQFNQTSHWVELKTTPRETIVSVAAKPEVEKLPDTLLTFVGYQDNKNLVGKFRINTMIPQYEKLLSGHLIAQTAPICPATVQIGLVVDAIRVVRLDLAGLEPQIHNVEYQSPVCSNTTRALFIEVTGDSGSSVTSWKFEVFSTDLHVTSKDKMLHTTGKVVFCVSDDPTLKLELARFERFFDYERCVSLLQSNEVDDVLQCRTIYRLFSDIVEYGEEYRGIQKLVSLGNQSAAHIIKKDHGDAKSWYDAHLADSFCQIGGIWINCMTDRSPNDIFIANGIEQWIRSPKLHQGPQPTSFHAFATHRRSSDRTSLTDVFVFNAADGSLVEVILGISYVRMPKVSMSKLLSRLTVGLDSVGIAASLSETAHADLSITSAEKAPSYPQQTSASKAPELPPPPKSQKQSPKVDVALGIKKILAELSGLELDEIKNDSELADLGIDSLIGMEMAHEIEVAYKIELPQDELVNITDLPGLGPISAGNLKGGNAGPAESEEEESDTDYKSGGPSSLSDGHTGTTTPDSASDRAKSPGGYVGTDLANPKISFDTIMEAFNETKMLTDERVAEYKQAGYSETVMPVQTEMCIALTLEAFEQLGCPIRDALAGQELARIPHQKEHGLFVDYLYKMLEKETQGIIVDDARIVRTAVPFSPKTSNEIYQSLLARFPDQDTANKLTFYAGSNLANVLSGKTDGIKLIFGSTEGRELVANFYADWPLNQVLYKLMDDFLTRLITKLDLNGSPLKILEMGAGTGGTTKRLLPLLAKLNIPCEYTFTDLAPSFVAAARKKFSKTYPFMKFRAHDIEKCPDDDLIGTQHIILSSNAVHATHSLCVSTANIRKALRPDGFLLMLEMTRTPYWVDMVFGLFEGWWLFDDGRTHALTHESRWEEDLQAVGYGHVDWTEGSGPDSEIEKLIIAMASDSSRCERLKVPQENKFADCAARQALVEQYVSEMTEGFAVKDVPFPNLGNSPEGKCILITGATGSLGSHLLAKSAVLQDISRVICLNRRSKQDPKERQQQALAEKGIVLCEEDAAKIDVFETDLSKPQLGLSDSDYEDLVNNVTHIIHNAWSMAFKWPVKRFKPQLQILRGLIDLASDISSQRHGGANSMVTFEFVSSIATVGHWPLWTGKSSVPEERMEIQSVLPTGYGDAKFICELMLDETLHKHPDRFRTMAVRLGQIAGSSSSGYWNRMEHVPFLVKSSKTLNALPDFDGVLSWTPVDKVAATLVDLVTLPDELTPHPVYHIDNPIRQSWKDMIIVLADALHIPRHNIIPFREWVQRVKDYPHGPRQVEEIDGDNPAILLIDFLDSNFTRMSCGGVLLGTANAREHSSTLANLPPVDENTARLFVKSWKDMGFLK